MLIIVQYAVNTIKHNIAHACRALTAGMMCVTRAGPAGRQSVWNAHVPAVHAGRVLRAAVHVHYNRHRGIRCRLR